MIGIQGSNPCSAGLCCTRGLSAPLVLIIDAIAEVGEPATFDQILQSVSSVRRSERRQLEGNMNLEAIENGRTGKNALGALQPTARMHV